MDQKLNYRSPEPSSPPKEASPKRSAEAAGLGAPDAKLNRKRAAKACRSCRSRKVRCSVSEHGIPCYNCKLDELECVVPERKRPTRTAKRQRSLGAVISEAVLRMDRTSSDPGDSPGESTQAASQFGWDKSMRSPYDTDVFAASSPSSLQHSGPEENAPCEGEAQGTTDLPPCDDELARWFGVMPPRIVDKMFNYLKALDQHARPESTCRAPGSAQSNGKVRLAPKRKSQDSTAPKPSYRAITPRPPEYAQQLLPSSSQASSPRQPQSPLPLSQTSQNEPSILQQLRDDYTAASERVHALENAIQTVNSQFTKHVHPPSGAIYTPTSTGSPLDTHTHSQPFNPNNNSALTPPPETQPSFVMSMQTLQQLEALLASVHRGSDARIPLKLASAAKGAHEMAEAGSRDGNGNGKREDEFQATFDSLIDFGPGSEAMFQGFNYDFV
ncbi:hypothetical protein FQN50_008934 [Emmonsiellopsis sp. PD_5]|nr:hypothetical protein FQN50_008934 [Emmonsiellopsis sp. PD_5]